MLPGNAVTVLMVWVGNGDGGAWTTRAGRYIASEWPVGLMELLLHNN